MFFNNRLLPELKKDRELQHREHNCLLLGCGEAGKSTFIKQMRIINEHKFTEEELKSFKQAMAVNIHSAMCLKCESARRWF